MAEKSLKIAVAADEASFRKAKILVDDLTRSIEKLAKASQTMGGAGGLLGGVTTNRTMPGLGGAAQFGGNQTLKGMGSGGVVGSILGGDAGAVRNLVSGTQQAFSSVTTNIKTFIDRATSDVSRLTRAMQDLNKASGGGGRGGTLPGIGAGQLGGTRAPDLNPYSGGVVVGPGGQLLQPPPGGGSPAAGWQNGVRNWIGGRAQAAAGWFGVPPAAAQQVGNFARANAGGVGIGLGVVAGYQLMNSAFEGNRAAQLDFALNEPTARLSRAAGIAAVGRASYSAGRGGDISYVKAQRDALNNREVRQALDASVLQREQVELALGMGPGIKGLTKQGKDWLMGKAGTAFGRIGQVLSGQELGSMPGGVAGELGGVEGMTELKIRLQKAVMDSQPELAGKFQTAIRANQMLQDPEFAMEANSAYGGAMGNLATRRQGFFGVPRGQDAIAYMKAREASNRAAGYTNEEEAGARRAIAGGAGMGYMRAFGGRELLSLQYGGASGVTDILRTQGILGGSTGAGTRFVRNAMEGRGGYGGIGAGGLDATVGSQLFAGGGASAVATGQFGAGNTGATYLQAMAALVGGGAGAPFDTAQQGRRLQMLEGGGANLQGFMSGSKAPLYQATSLMASISAAGGYGSASESLMRADGRMLKGVAAGGDVPEWLRSQGIDRGQVTSFLGKSARAPLYEVVDELVGGDAGKLLKQVRGAEANGGSFKDVLKGKTVREQQKMLEQLGGVLYSQGLAPSPDAGAGTFLAQLNGEQGYTALKGRGVGAAGPAGLEKDAVHDQADALRSASKTIANSVNEMKALFDTSGERKGGRTGVASARGNVAHIMEDSVGQVAAQLDLLAGNIAKVNERFAKMQQRAR